MTNFAFFKILLGPDCSKKINRT